MVELEDFQKQTRSLALKLQDFFSFLCKQLLSELYKVKETFAQYPLQIVFLCVIISYLIYYFSRLSKRPKLVGCDRSRFVKFIRDNLSEHLEKRFSPLIYFWGTNPQTALFGYLQGQTSANELPRSNFYRQYLYVSDAQYLTSNVDLSKHYEEANKSKLASMTTSPSATNSTIKTTTTTTRTCRKEYLLELRPDDRLFEEATSQLGKNLRVALESGWQLKKGGDSESRKDERSDSIELSSGCSSDSGVSLVGCRSPSSSSSSSCSTSSLTDSSDRSSTACGCKRAYSDHLSALNLSTTGDPSDRACLRREHLQHGQCALDWYKLSHEQYHKNQLVALISAGMTTGSDKKYVTDTVCTLSKLGYEVCVFIRRGVGGLKLSSDKFFSPAKWRDLEAAVLSIRKQRPRARLVAVGFSFGSIELCRYLAMSGTRSRIHAALLISCPFDPEAGGRNMQKRPLNRKIDAYLAKNLGKQLHQALADVGAQTNCNGSVINLAELPKVRSLVDFENNYNRALQNYPNIEAYAADSRLQDHLGRIKTPTLCLSSEDDFMAPVHLLPLEQIRANENLCMLLTKCGGHMAFIDGILWPTKPYFAQRIVVSYMSAIRKSADLFSPTGFGLWTSKILAQSSKDKTSQHHLIQMLNEDEQQT